VIQLLAGRAQVQLHECLVEDVKEQHIAEIDLNRITVADLTIRKSFEVITFKSNKFTEGDTC
jgi:hypothetical protein